VRADVYLSETITWIRITQFSNHKVKERLLKKGDMVLRNMEATIKGEIQGKFTLNWDGPYMIMEEMGPRTFRLTRPKYQEP